MVAEIQFVAKDKSLKRGSYRIHVADLNYYLNEIGVTSSINGSGNVKIYDKGLSPSKSDEGMFGCITPDSLNESYIKKFDFAIVGSIEEKESLIKHIDNVFLFPQIEKMYLDIEPKVHSEKEPIVIGYHGNPNHLNHMDLGLKQALESLHKKCPVQLLIGKSRLCSISSWKKGKPNIPIEYFDWDLKTISKNILRFDIGITPNISAFKVSSFSDHNINMGMYKSDMQIRFKNKSNIGRNLVLMQHGIPVVTDLTPSCMHIFANPDNGYAVLTEDGWYNALSNLLDFNHRNEVAQNAYSECKRLYDPLKWAKKLYEKIESLYNERN